VHLLEIWEIIWSNAKFGKLKLRSSTTLWFSRFETSQELYG
jgi:hypothetical protein